jgi:hypothetical protein
MVGRFEITETPQPRHVFPEEKRPRDHGILCPQQGIPYEAVEVYREMTALSIFSLTALSFSEYAFDGQTGCRHGPVPKRLAGMGPSQGSGGVLRLTDGRFSPSGSVREE